MASKEFLDTFECNEKFWNHSKTLTLLLDYDGTLAEITPDPNLTLMDAETKDILTKISEVPSIYLAIISGRAVSDIKGKIQLKDNIIYAGNHGFEILFPNGTHFNQEIPQEMAENFRRIVEELEPLATNGAWLENKIFSMTFHYEQVDDVLIPALEAKVKEIIQRNHFSPIQGPKILETRPPIPWNKGKAALFLLESEFGQEWAEKTNAIFFGDADSDEDVMKALKGKGLSFRISSDPDVVSYADYRISSVADVTNILKKIYSKVGKPKNGFQFN